MGERGVFRWVGVRGFALVGALLFGSFSMAQTPVETGPATEKAPTAKLGAPAAQTPPTQAPSTAVSPAYRDVVDEVGRTVRLPQPVERIVSLAPSLTETVYALGLQDHLVGDTAYCDYPADAKKKPKVGGSINPSIELVASLRPDVVLVTESANRFETVRALDDLKIASYATKPHTVQEIIASTLKLADALGAPAAGTALAEDLQQRLLDLQHRIGELPARRVLFVVWTEPLITAGKNTFIADALRKAGAVSVVDSTQDWPQVSLEEVVRQQPEFLVFAAMHEETTPTDLLTLTARPGWRSLEAVRNHKFVVISDAVNRPAPRIVSAIEELARQLHPEAFQEAPANPANPNDGKTDKPAPEKPVSPTAAPPVARELSFARPHSSMLGFTANEERTWSL